MTFDFSQHTALFGGSFNPPHVGHVEAVKGLFLEPKVAKAWVIPSFGTPLKEVSVRYEHRLEMTRIAFKEVMTELPVEISDLERKIKSQYSWQLLQELQGIFPKRVLVIGTDQFEQLDRWNRFQDLVGMTDWVILLRKPKTLLDFAPVIQKFTASGLLKNAGDDLHFQWASGTKLQFVHTDAPEVSATELRGYFTLGKTQEIKKRLPSGVYEYLEGNQLYAI